MEAQVLTHKHVLTIANALALGLLGSTGLLATKLVVVEVPVEQDNVSVRTELQTSVQETLSIHKDAIPMLVNVIWDNGDPGLIVTKLVVAETV